jgi:hypothetical protein
MYPSKKVHGLLMVDGMRCLLNLSVGLACAHVLTMLLCGCTCGCRAAWLSYYKIFKMPVLVALNPADTARQMEALTDKQIVEEAMQVGGARSHVWVGKGRGWGGVGCFFLEGARQGGVGCILQWST